MIVVTGSAGFIGRNLVEYLNRHGFYDLILVDEYRNNPTKSGSLKFLGYSEIIDRRDFFVWAKENHEYVDFVFHLGARTDTTEKDEILFSNLNFKYSQDMWNFCSDYDVPLLYASSAATFGNGELGFDNGFEKVDLYTPLNHYANSKNEFDKWVKQQIKTPPRWVGFKFFNVYGPGESHKKRMASVVWHSFSQIKNTGKIKLFRSHRQDFGDGEQCRDFIHVSDVVNVCFRWMNSGYSGLYNLGSGTASTFLELSNCIFQSLGIEKQIEWIDTPIEIRDSYQYFTQADMSWMRKQRWDHRFMSLPEGVSSYIKTLNDLESVPTDI